MRPASLTLLALLTLVGMAPAGAASDADTIRQFGMLGRQAVNCAEPASRSNPYLIFAVSPQGNVTRTLQMEPSLDGTFAMRNLRLLTPDRLQYEETGRQAEFIITVAKIDGKFRSWHSIRADGKVMIRDGAFPDSGTPTLAFELCRN